MKSGWWDGVPQGKGGLCGNPPSPDGSVGARDVLATTGARDADAVGCLVCRGACGGDRLSHRCHAEEAAAVRHELSVVQRGAGMKDERPICLGISNALDRGAAVAGVRVVTRDERDG